MLVVLAAAAAGWLAYSAFQRSGGQPLAWRDISSTVAGLEVPRQTDQVFRSRSGLVEYLDSAMPGRPPAAPEIDFRRATVLLVAAGARSSTGYGVEVVEVEEQRSRIAVTVRERTPKLGDNVTPGVTFPFKLLALRATGKTVDVRWEGRP